ncbi:MAG: hypothetical protein KF745_12500 [Phycisphaeraceae bacterium]|nr:hypothetical protein [Phycisphaeraceae bacterium]
MPFERDVLWDFGREKLHIEKIELAELFPFPWLRPCTVRILMVVDGYPGSTLNVSFNHSYFGLSHVLDALRNDERGWVRFQVTRAHRQTDTAKPNAATEPVAWSRYGPHYENFRFSQDGFNINDYDQVWLFGARSEEAGLQQLSDAELEVLARWMDQGGGVFATGDHADLGASLCSRIPRVRSMRRWTAAQGVPPPTGSSRHDTLLKGHDSTYTFDDESDDIPMPLRVRKYGLRSFVPWQWRAMPHPVLCGRTGVIDILPDHPHEGDVIDASLINLNAPFDVGTFHAPEYPGSGPSQIKPQIIAWARVQSDHTNSSDTNKGAANGKEFGVIGAYDGQAAGIGRVVVDSTWHHWFDVNLIGRPGLPANNPKSRGFLDTPAGQQSLRRLDDYFVNVALWLAPPQRQKCMLARSMWKWILRYPAVERLSSRMPIWELGQTAKDAIGRNAGQCLISSWIRDFLVPDLHQLFELPDLIPDPPPNPCLTCPPWDLVEIYVLGGITRTLLELAYKVQDGPSSPNEQMSDELVVKTMLRGSQTGGRALVDAYRKSLTQSGEWIRRAQPTLTQEITAEQYLRVKPLRARTTRQARSTGGGRKRPKKK